MPRIPFLVLGALALALLAGVLGSGDGDAPAGGSRRPETGREDPAAPIGPASARAPGATAAPTGPRAVAATPSPEAPSTRFEVRVLEFGEPVTGLEVAFLGPGGERRATTDHRGAVAVDLAEGEWRLEIPSRGLVTAVRATGLPTASVELRVPGLAAIEGTVVDAESHAPIAGASVEVFPPDSPRENAAYERLAATRTDGEGRFRLAGLPERPVALAIERRSHESFEEVVTPSDEVREIRLRPLGGFRLRIVDAAGRTAALWPVTIELAAPGGTLESHDVFLDEQGTLYVSDLVAGMYRFRARVDGTWTRESSAFASPEEDLPIELEIDHALEARDDIPIPPGPEDRFDPDDPHPQHHPHRHRSGEHH